MIDLKLLLHYALMLCKASEASCTDIYRPDYTDIVYYFLRPLEAKGASNE